MYCKKCGYKLEEDAKICPFCNHKVDEEIVKYEEKQTVKEETIGNNNNGLVNYEKIDNEAVMSDVRTSLGYVNLKTKFWHHVLIACGGYLLMNLIFSVVGSAILSGYMNKGYNFDCIMHATTTSEMYACPIEQLSPYLFVSSIGQVIGELGIVLVVLLIFIKYLKTFVENKFDVLDSVKTITFSNKMPVTLSLAIVLDDASKAEKLHNAFSTLDNVSFVVDVPLFFCAAANC